MPSFVGPIKINSVEGGAVVQMGDCLYIAPKVATKALGGSGGFNTGDLIMTNNVISFTNAIDSDVFDQNVTANN